MGVRAPGIYNSKPFRGSTILSDAPGKLEWDPVPGATSYDLYFGTNRTEPLPVLATGLANAQFALPQLLPDTTYHWRVVAHLPSGDVMGPYFWLLTVHSAVGVPDEPPSPTPGSGILALADGRPSPTRAASTIFFTLPQAGRVNVSVYDAAGRRVRNLVDAEQSAGEQRVVWDGRDDQGRSLGGGVFMVRLVWNGQTLVSRVVKL